MRDFIKRIIFRIFPQKNPPPASVLPEPKGETVQSKPRGAKYVKQEALDSAILLVQTKIDTAYIIMGVVIIALTICFITLFFEYQGFIAQSFNEYNNQVRELRNEKDSLFNLHLLDLENKVGTTSGK